MAVKKGQSKKKQNRARWDRAMLEESYKEEGIIIMRRRRRKKGGIGLQN